MVHRTDGNHKTIIATYKRIGFSVEDTSAVGHGFPDLVVGLWGITDLVEVKDPAQQPSARKLNKDQRNFFDNWRGRRPRIVLTDADVEQHRADLYVQLASKTPLPRRHK